MINIVVADNHNLVRKGLRALFSEQSDFKVVGEAKDGPEALEKTGELDPNILVLDIMIKELNGLEITRILAKQYPKIGIVILTMYSDEGYVVEALRSGARAYVLKYDTPENLIFAIHEAAAGRQFLSPMLNVRAIEAYQQSPVFSADPIKRLSIREKEIFDLAIQGNNSTNISSKLGISQRTVEAHQLNVMHKLGLHSYSDLIRFAIKRGLISNHSKN